MLKQSTLHTKLTERVRMRMRKGSRSRVSSLPMAQPTSTSTGSTKMAIWMLLPRATPIARSILFCRAGMKHVMQDSLDDLMA